MGLKLRRNIDLHSLVKAAIHSANIVNPYPANAEIFAEEPVAGIEVDALGNAIPSTTPVVISAWLKNVESVSREPSQTNAGQREVEVKVSGRLIDPLTPPSWFDNSKEYKAVIGGIEGILRLTPEPSSGFELEAGLADDCGTKIGTRVTGVFVRSPHNH